MSYAMKRRTVKNLEGELNSGDENKFNIVEIKERWIMYISKSLHCIERKLVWFSL